MRILVLFLTVSFGNFVHGQSATDTVELDFDAFLEMVRDNHPISKSAALQTEKGDANLLKAKGQFDPKVGSSLSQKYFDEKQYYSLLGAGLKVPTWVGIDVEAGFDQTSGVFLNPENNTPQTGLFYAGISIPLGQGLFMDERRSAVLQARAFGTLMEAERRLQLNELYYNSGKAYWDWYAAYQIKIVYEEAVRVVQARIDGVEQSILLGDRPAIDTLEAGIQLQNRKLKLQEAELNYANTSAYLSTFLWANGIVPMELQSGTVPLITDDVEMHTSKTLPFNPMEMDSLINKHPVLQQYDAKRDQLDVKSRWQREQLKPNLDLKYNPITEPVGSNPLANLSLNNYTWGFAFSMPILLRKERGSLRMTGLELRELDYNQNYKRQSLLQQTQIAMNTYVTTSQQYVLYRQNRTDYGRLLDGERQMFEGGESSLFMVNSRETAYISAQIQLIKTMALHQKAYLEVQYVLGTLAN